MLLLGIAIPIVYASDSDNNDDSENTSEQDYSYKTTDQLIELIALITQEYGSWDGLAEAGKPYCDELLSRPEDKTSDNGIFYYACESRQNQTGE